jgi:PPM family protein phosphatase
MKITISSESNMGKRRTNNEDLGLVQNALVCDTPVKSYFDLDVEAPVIAAIADGMGGLDDGEIASMMVIDSLRDWLETLSSDANTEQIIASFNHWIPITNNKIISACHTRGMGTTLVGLVFTRHAVIGFNVGDSRLYRFREGWLRQISTDHSQRKLTEDLSVPSNLIYNCFGAVKNTFADYFDITSNIKDGDLFLICSDGLSDLLSDDNIEDLLNKGATTADLIEAANKAGGKDNITVGLITTFC